MYSRLSRESTYRSSELVGYDDGCEMTMTRSLQLHPHACDAGSPATMASSLSVNEKLKGFEFFHFFSRVHRMKKKNFICPTL